MSIGKPQPSPSVSAEDDRDAFAIVGMSCELPCARNYEAFWDILEARANCISTVPPDRWDAERYFASTADGPNHSVSKWGGFLENPYRFDAEFFGISPREARAMDPQQRLLLQVSWACIEDAGYAPTSFAGRAVGVFVAVGTLDYRELGASSPEVEGHIATGTFTALIANRISYFLDLRGPSVPVDTACSGSLVALHQAMESIRAGDCEEAIVGGVSVMSIPNSYISFSQLGMLSPTGQCRSFDADADGYVRGEGVALVLLKPLAKALADGDDIRAVVLGSAVNHGGRARTLTSPGVFAQSKVIAAALQRAHVSPESIGYVEAHGTGTPLGDPIEVNALKRAFRDVSGREHCIGIGTAKTNVGHLESVAGMVGLFKVVLAMQRRKLPGMPNFKRLNPRISLDRSPFYIVEQTGDWPVRPDREGGRTPLRAGISSFGFGGVNAHVIVEEAPPRVTRKLATRSAHLVTFSARTPEALRASLAKHADFLDEHRELALPDVSWTLSAGRVHMEHRVAVVASSCQSLAESVRAAMSGTDSDAISIGMASDTAPKVGFLFTGQGSQYPGMGRELYDTQPLYRQTLERCDALLRKHLDKPLLAVLFHEEGMGSDLHQTAYTQPALFAVEYALARLLESFGVRPQAVLGHSVGEYVAACIAGVFDLEDALQLIAARGRLMQALPPDGSMAVAMTSAARVEAAIAPFAHEVAIAAYNGPANVVFSGRTQAVETITATLRQGGTSVTPLSVSHAFHSPLVEPMLEEFERIAQQVRYSQPRIPIVSNVTGAIAGAEIATAAYWRRHVREAVRFEEGMRALERESCRILFELGPHPVLIGMARAAQPDSGDAVWCPSLRRGQSDWSTLLASLGRAYVQGAELDGVALQQGAGGRRIALPTYAFQGDSYRVNYQVPIAADGLAGALRDADEPALLRRLTATAQFTAQELALLPRLLRALRDSSSPLSSKGPGSDLLYEIAWRERSLVCPDPTPTRISVRELEPALQQLARTFPSQANLATELDLASRAHIGRGLLALGWNPSPGEEFEASALAQQLGIPSRHRPVFARMLATLLGDGTLESRNAGYRVVRKVDASASTPTVAAAGSLELALLNRCGSELASVLRGSRDPLALLFPEGETASTRAFYRDAAAAAAHNALARQALQCIVANFPRNRTLRILEIGAGTGGTTAHLLPILDRVRTQYVFTDASGYFLKQAEREFADFPFLQFRTLDIETAPAAQGWGESAFDVVVASNVLHATRDLRQSLRHVRSLLSPGGVLLLIEASEGRPWIDLTFGLTEGWWRFRDRSLRECYPLLTGESWCRVLEEEGFDQTLTIAPAAPAVLPQSLVVARASEVSEPARAQQPSWVIVDAGGNTGARLAERLRRRGKRCLASSVSVGAGVRHVEGIVYFAPCDSVLSADAGALQVMAAARAALEPALDLIKDAVRNAHARSARVCIVTQFAASADSARVEGLAQATLWGLGAGVAIEHPELQCTRIDIDGTEGRTLDALADELLTGSGEDRIAFREGRRWVPRLHRTGAQLAGVESAELPIDASAAYLVTGGLRGLGLRFAEWLFERGARHLVLVGRRAPEPSTETVLERLRERGATVIVRTIDVSDGAAMKELIGEFGHGLPALHGILHAAGELDDAVLMEQDWQRFAHVFAAKVAGAWHLHCATLTQPLDFFVLFSSATALVGNAGQANHAAANAFLDQLAHVRRASGLPALSMNWGAWSDIGAAAGTRIAEHIGRRGFMPFTPEEGVAAAGVALRARVGQLVAVKVDWVSFAQNQSMPLIADLVDAPAMARGGEVTEDIRSALQAASVEQRAELLFERVRAEVARVIGVADPAAISAEKGFFSLGLDSLTSVELRNRLQKKLRAELPSTVAFDYPTLLSLTEFLRREALTDLFVPAEAAAEVAVAPAIAGKSGAPALALAAGSEEDEIARELAELQSVLARG